MASLPADPTYERRPIKVTPTKTTPIKPTPPHQTPIKPTR
jgi:hypothetical protein